MGVLIFSLNFFRGITVAKCVKNGNSLSLNEKIVNSIYYLVLIWRNCNLWFFREINEPWGKYRILLSRRHSVEIAELLSHTFSEKFRECKREFLVLPHCDRLWKQHITQRSSEIKDKKLFHKELIPRKSGTYSALWSMHSAFGIKFVDFTEFLLALTIECFLYL